MQLALPRNQRAGVQALDAQGQVLTNVTDTIHVVVHAPVDDPVENRHQRSCSGPLCPEQSLSSCGTLPASPISVAGA
jgi:hypothetical protein